MESFCHFVEEGNIGRLQDKLLEKILKQMKSTCVGGDANRHRATVCVVCDEIIFGMEPIQNISKSRLLDNETRLCVSQYEEHFGIELHPELVRQYQVIAVTVLIVCVVCDRGKLWKFSFFSIWTGARQRFSTLAFV